MTPRQLKFIEEYPIDRNGAQAAIRAGYAEKGARAEAHRLLTNVDICIAVCEKIEDMTRLARIDAAWVLKRAGMLADFNIESFIVTVGGNAFYDFTKATRDDWYCISEYVTKTIGKRGQLIPVDEIKIKTYCKLRALELVGKHTGVQAFKERIEHSGPGGGPIRVISTDMSPQDAQEAYADTLNDG